MIIRRKVQHGFTVMPRAAFEDTRLTFQARGVLAYILVKPDNWRVHVSDLAKNAGPKPSGRDRVYGILDELKAAGYLTFRQVRGQDGRLGDGEYIVTDAPVVSDAPDTENPDTAKPDTENPDAYIRLTSTKDEKETKTKVQPPRPAATRPATIPALKRRDPKPLFDAFRGTFPTSAAALAGQFDAAASAAGLTAADWEAFIATAKAAQDLSDGYLTPRTAMTRFQAWAKGKGKSAGSRRTNAEWEAIHLAPSRKGYR